MGDGLILAVVGCGRRGRSIGVWRCDFVVGVVIIILQGMLGPLALVCRRTTSHHITSQKDHLDCWTVMVSRPYKIGRASAIQDFISGHTRLVTKRHWFSLRCYVKSKQPVLYGQNNQSCMAETRPIMYVRDTITVQQSK